MTGTYMLTEEKAKEYLKEALDGKSTLFQRVSSQCTVNCTDPAEVAGQLIDSILQDVINVVKTPWSDKEFGMLDVLVNDLQAADRGEKTVLPCRIYDAYGKWDIIM